MAKTQIGKEFVERYSEIKHKTGDNPSQLIAALDNDPQLAKALTKIGRLIQLIERKRRIDQHRYITRAHPDFRQALEDFRKRWMNAYNESRDWICERALIRISDQFLWRYRLLIDRTGNDPNAAYSLRRADRELDYTIMTLWEIERALNETAYGFDHFLDRISPDFHNAMADFRNRWLTVALSLDISPDEI